MNDFMNSDFIVTRISLACFVPAGTGNATHKNRPGHGLAINTGGVKEYIFSDGQKFIVKENDIIYLPKYSSYTVSSRIVGDCYAINFDIADNIVFSPFVITVKNNAAFIKNFKDAVRAWNNKEVAYTAKCMAELYNIIYFIKHEYLARYFPKTKLEIIRSAVDFIHKNYASQSISVDSLSKMCNITPEYFRKIFKSFYGTSPIKYINNLKITHAKELLESGMFSVSETAEYCGYSDFSHFSREFKNAVGVAPSEYRQMEI